MLTNAAVRALRARLGKALDEMSTRDTEGLFEQNVITLDRAQLQYLVNLLGSHLTWRSYLVPED